MKHEFHAQYAFALKDSTTQPFALDWLVGKSTRVPHRWPEIRELGPGADDFARLMVLAQAIATGYKDQARVGGRRDPGGLYYWIRHKSRAWLQKRMKLMQDALGLTNHHDTLSPSLPDLSTFPPGSWAVQVAFTLKKPYISKDDTVFYILDNPVKKEWVFKVPYVAPSQWKGALRAAMVRKLVEYLHAGKKDGKDFTEEHFIQERIQLYRLFGNEKDGTSEFLNRALALKRVGPRPENGSKEEIKEWEDRFKREQKEQKEIEKKYDKRLREEKYKVGEIKGYRGRLHFYPTFFDRIGLEVINPHPRDTGAGKNPIYFECVPEETPGVFTLLYVPLDAGPKDEDTIKADLAAVARGIRAMLTEYGFGAKTSSGYGVAEPKDSEIEIKANGLPEAENIFRATLLQEHSTPGGEGHE